MCFFDEMRKIPCPKHADFIFHKGIEKQFWIMLTGSIELDIRMV